jgi:predicted N-acetyltransferase YhbS
VPTGRQRGGSSEASLSTGRAVIWRHVAQLAFRLARPADAKAVANLHADSWRHHYRGAYSDAFLDGDVVADRLAVWTDRLREPDPQRCTILAEDGSLVGFASTVFAEDTTWGALLDNLHVADGHKRRGVGSRLLGLTAEAVIERSQETDRSIPVGSRAEPRRPRLLPGPGWDMCGARFGDPARRGRGPTDRIAGEAPIRVAGAEYAARAPVSDAGG